MEITKVVANSIGVVSDEWPVASGQMKPHAKAQSRKGFQKRKKDFLERMNGMGAGRAS
jgi:hypothetical protein